MRSCLFAECKARAFTLIELLITLSILLILSTLVLLNLQESQVRSRIARVCADTRTIASALEVYRLDYRAYPVAADEDVMLDYPLVPLTTPVGYITTVPADPFGIAAYDFAPDVTRLGYLYLDAASTSRGMPGETYGHIWKAEPTRKYMIHSCGPNRRWDVTPYREYDAINGTTSNGDICTFGPM